MFQVDLNLHHKSPVIILEPFMAGQLFHRVYEVP